MARKLAQQRDSPAHQVGALKSTKIIFFVVKFYFIYRNIECVLQTTNGVFYMLSTIKVKFAISSATILAIGRFCKYPQPPNKSLWKQKLVSSMLQLPRRSQTCCFPSAVCLPCNPGVVMVAGVATTGGWQGHQYRGILGLGKFFPELCSISFQSFLLSCSFVSKLLSTSFILAKKSNGGWETSTAGRYKA